jgi:hypothetical protein
MGSGRRLWLRCAPGLVRRWTGRYLGSIFEGVTLENPDGAGLARRHCLVWPDPGGDGPVLRRAYAWHPRVENGMRRRTRAWLPRGLM